MTSYIGLEHVLEDQFRPYQVSKGNVFSVPHAIFVLSVPFMAAIISGCCAGSYVAKNADILMAAFAVIASVMTAIMPTIHGLVGDVEEEQVEKLLGGDLKRDEDVEESKNLIAKMEIVRSLYAAVAWSVILLVAAIVPLLILKLSFFVPSETQSLDRLALAARSVLAAMIAYAGATAFVSLMQIVTGVHLMIRYRQSPLEEKLAKLKDRYGV